MNELVGTFAGLKCALAPDEGFAYVKLGALILEVAVTIEGITTFVVQQTNLWQKAGVVLRKQDPKLGFIEAKNPMVFQDLDVDRRVDIMGKGTHRPERTQSECLVEN